jgi:hypothetical protein
LTALAAVFVVLIDSPDPVLDKVIPDVTRYRSAALSVSGDHTQRRLPGLDPATWRCGALYRSAVAFPLTYFRAGPRDPWVKVEFEALG